MLIKYEWYKLCVGVYCSVLWIRLDPYVFKIGSKIKWPSRTSLLWQQWYNHLFFRKAILSPLTVISYVHIFSLAGKKKLGSIWLMLLPNKTEMLLKGSICGGCKWPTHMMWPYSTHWPLCLSLRLVSINICLLCKRRIN